RSEGNRALGSLCRRAEYHVKDLVSVNASGSPVGFVGSKRAGRGRWRRRQSPRRFRSGVWPGGPRPRGDLAADGALETRQGLTQLSGDLGDLKLYLEDFTKRRKDRCIIDVGFGVVASG